MNRYVFALSLAAAGCQVTGQPPSGSPGPTAASSTPLCAPLSETGTSERAVAMPVGTLRACLSNDPSLLAFTIQADSAGGATRALLVSKVDGTTLDSRRYLGGICVTATEPGVSTVMTFGANSLSSRLARAVDKCSAVPS